MDSGVRLPSSPPLLRVYLVQTGASNRSRVWRYINCLNFNQMKIFVCLLSLSLTLFSAGFSSYGQVTYPYNPDGNSDTLIGVSDLQDVLSVYGASFVAEGIVIDSISLEDYLGVLLQRIEELEELAFGQGGLIHGHIDILPGEQLEWIVPDGINMLEVTISGGTGGTGQGTNACPYTDWLPRSGCGGGAGGQGTVLIQVAKGDTVFVQAGSTPATPSPLADCGLGQQGSGGSAGSLYINSELIISATGGGGGRGVWCYCGGDGYHGCGGSYHPNNPGVGGIIGPGIDTGAILTSESTGGGACLIRY